MVEIVFPEETIVFFLWLLTFYMTCYSNKVVQVVLGICFSPVFALILWNYHDWNLFSLPSVFILFAFMIGFYGFYRIIELRA